MWWSVRQIEVVGLLEMIDVHQANLGGSLCEWIKGVGTAYRLGRLAS